MRLEHEYCRWDAWAKTVDARLAWLHNALGETNLQAAHSATVVPDDFS